MIVLVLGASGYTGLSVVRHLRAQGDHVRAFLRRPAAEADVRAAGANEVVIGNLLDLRAVAAAARGVDGIFFIGPRMLAEEAALGKAVIDVAVSSGARRFVFSGVYHPTIRSLFNHQSKRRIEDHLYATDLEFVVLQPARYMHGLLLPGWTRIVEDGLLLDTFSPESRLAYVDYNDVAEVVALAFHDDRLARGTYELSSPGEHTLHDIAAALSVATGRPIRAQQTPWDQLGPERRGMGNPYSEEGFKRLAAYYNQHGFRGGNSLVLDTILGRTPNGFPDFWRQESERRDHSAARS